MTNETNNSGLALTGWNQRREERRDLFEAHILDDGLFTLQPRFLLWLEQVRAKYTLARHLNQLFKDLQGLEVSMPEMFDPATTQGAKNIEIVDKAIREEDITTLKRFISAYTKVRCRRNLTQA